MAASATSRIYSGRTCTACCRARQAPSALLETLPYPVQSVAANALAAAVHASEGGAIRGSLVGPGSTCDELPSPCWSRGEAIRGPWAKAKAKVKVKDKESGKTPQLRRGVETAAGLLMAKVQWPNHLAAAEDWTEVLTTDDAAL
ncbi:hypothetical protein M419DRAFT_6840 [Trichoderma reesei RUT C-30]|uniref:Uncharacterized protein n=1 Tax=Hypocrea jecorina (strain ATCC 56765 / BCRC 32924 / NRRL 11460 / Rut C-30) TaxID=1344414 RepID=A0A024SF69_HYPJR|nr:hypothetical protein M419DRAFT_6840 [Trichoderma reesei RUT C-30]